jgi:DNA primase
MDVVALAAAGIAEAVAPLGTALTEDQLELLWRSGPEPIFCFDGDGAGLRAASRALDLALPKLSPSRTLRVAVLPDGLDPDDVLRRDGAAALTPLLDQPDSLERLQLGVATPPDGAPRGPVCAVLCKLTRAAVA